MIHILQPYTQKQTFVGHEILASCIILKSYLYYHKSDNAFNDNRKHLYSYLKSGLGSWTKKGLKFGKRNQFSGRKLGEFHRTI